VGDVLVDKEQGVFGFRDDIGVAGLTDNPEATDAVAIEADVGLRGVVYGGVGGGVPDSESGD